MKNDIIINAYNTIQPGDELKNRIFEKITQKQYNKRPIFKAAASFAAAAAVICLIVFGSMLLIPQANNTFAIKAYAIEVQDDGSIELCEVDAVNAQPEYTGFYIDRETNTMYVGIGLRCDGEKIEDVEFSTNNGFFAKQYIGDSSDISTDGVPAMYVGSSQQMVIFGTDFENIGDRITLDKDAVGNYLLFWGTDDAKALQQSAIPLQISVHVKATFLNGKTAERDVTIDMSNTSLIGIINLIGKDKTHIQGEYVKLEELLRSIPLDHCLVVPLSDKVFTTYGDTYEVHFFDDMIMDSTHVGYFPITKESINAAVDKGLFDENGIPYDLLGLEEENGSDGNIAVIYKHGDNRFNFKVFKAPKQLVLENIER